MISNIEKRFKEREPLQELADLTRKVASEGIVILENKSNVLPLSNKRVAVFGRIQTSYYKSGTGSGGLVNVKCVPSILDALESSGCISVDAELKNVYQQWIEENPFDEGNGQWASEPWAQNEMPVSDVLAHYFSEHNDIALVIIGRTAGEDRDHFAGKGSYYLTDLEENLIKTTTTYFKKTIVILNVGNIIDTSWVLKYPIDGLVYAFSGGMYGAYALVDVLTNRVPASGKLPTTIAKNLEDYPSNKQFGHHGVVYYEEDIYVGYRYFESFNQEAVLYPFGYGLTYSKFDMNLIKVQVTKKTIELDVEVLNSGNTSAKEVIQIYMKSSQGKLGKAQRVLIAFSKTKLLKPKERTVVSFDIPKYTYASFDDEGLIFDSSYVIEKGLYQIYMGGDVRSAKNIFSFNEDKDLVLEKMKQNGAPVRKFKRMKSFGSNYVFEDVPLKKQLTQTRINNDKSIEIPKNNNNLKLIDVYDGKTTLDQFIGQLSVESMAQLIRAEGMSSPKVTPGTAAAFGGVTDNLKAYGIPILCAADGPSGIRMDSGLYASSLPSGTALAASFNTELVEGLYILEGFEMRSYDIDLLLGPGMNIHRHPLNGRNFEYFSEDPLLTGMMAVAVSKGLGQAGVFGSLKHLAVNNQETDRFNVDAVVSQRALREIYLKGFEIAVKSGYAHAIMTAYNPVNGIWSASQYEINKAIVRDEWGYGGLIITDWWAKMNDEANHATKENTKAMIVSQNDIYMVVSDAQANSNDDNTIESFKKGQLKKAQLQTVTKNILRFILKSPAFLKAHQINISSFSSSKSPWFKVKKPMIELPQLKSIYVNGKMIEPELGIYHYVLNEDQINEVETSQPHQLNHDKTVLTVHAENDSDTIVYQFNIKQKLEKTAHELPFFPLHVLDEKPWQAYHLQLEKYVEKSESIKLINHSIEVTGKRATITYAIDVLETSKYIFEFSIEAKASHLAQLPFSIIIDQVQRSTLTLRDTAGETVIVKSFIILDKGKRHMHLIFNKSNIKIHQLHILRHG